MRVFKNAWFARFARKENIDDVLLWDAAGRASRGLIDADLGGCVLKQRISRRGAGKSSGYRSILLFRRPDMAVFVYGFAKNSRENIDESERLQFKKMAAHIFRLSEDQISALLINGQFEEVNNDD